MNASFTRRVFLRQGGSAAALMSLPQIVPSSVLGLGESIAPSNRIVMGAIGVGGRGINNMQGLMRDERVQMVAVCDVWNRWGRNGRECGREPAREIVERHYAQGTASGTWRGCRSHRDFRDLIETREVDAVAIGTPDHWHAVPAIMAARAGKDIYCEKPLSLTIAEGRAMSDAVARHRRVFQTGSQQRSDSRFRHGCELVRNGRIGELLEVECGLPGGWSARGWNVDRTSPEPVPRGFDYDFWLGPAPDAPFAPARVGATFRWNYDYSGGQLTDWGGHHPDIAQWGMGTTRTGPVSIRKARGVWPDHPVWNTATEYHFEAHYRSGVVMRISTELRGGVTFKGSEGRVHVNRGRIEAHPESLLEETFGEGDIRLTESANHYRNFIDCVLSRQEPVAPVEEAHRSISIAHLGNIAMLLGRDLDWDPDREQVRRDPAAHAMLNRPYRAPWVLPV